MASENEIKIFEELTKIGCCNRCALRYLAGDRNLVSFEDPTTSLIAMGLVSPLEELDIEPQRKKLKENPCVICVGLLQDFTLDEICNHQELGKLTNYANDSFKLFITFASASLIREHSVKVYLKRMFLDCLDVDKIVQIKHAWRLSVENRLSQTINKKFNTQGNLAVHFTTDYILDKEEVNSLQRAVHETYSLSKRHLASILGEISDEAFLRFIRVPPMVPLYHVTLSDFKWNSESLVLMGSYWKYSRSLLIAPSDSGDGEMTIESIILNATRSALKECGKLTFHASSYDYPFVRVLGEGRKFFIQIDDPKFSFISRKDCRIIELLVNKSAGIKIKNLIQSRKNDVKIALESQAQAPRTVKVLCLLEEPKSIDSCVSTINTYKTINVHQLTPIKFLNRRDHQDKVKKIYYVKATKVAENLIELDLCASVNLQIVEFVTGEFGRTTPSLREIIKSKVDVVAIDIVGLNTPVWDEDVTESS